MSKLYTERDIIEQGDYYSRHTSAMTGEGLDRKSDIAAELAHRDIQIDQLQARVAELEESKYNFVYEVLASLVGKEHTKNVKINSDSQIFISLEQYKNFPHLHNIDFVKTSLYVERYQVVIVDKSKLLFVNNLF